MERERSARAFPTLPSAVGTKSGQGRPACSERSPTKHATKLLPSVTKCAGEGILSCLGTTGPKTFSQFNFFRHLLSLNGLELPVLTLVLFRFGVNLSLPPHVSRQRERTPPPCPDKFHRRPRGRGLPKRTPFEDFWSSPFPQTPVFLISLGREERPRPRMDVPDTLHSFPFFLFRGACKND